jgi:hypothetical protein
MLASTVRSHAGIQSPKVLDFAPTEISLAKSSSEEHSDFLPSTTRIQFSPLESEDHQQTHHASRVRSKSVAAAIVEATATPTDGGNVTPPVGLSTTASVFLQQQQSVMSQADDLLARLRRRACMGSVSPSTKAAARLKKRLEDSLLVRTVRRPLSSLARAAMQAMPLSPLAPSSHAPTSVAPRSPALDAGYHSFSSIL